MLHKAGAGGAEMGLLKDLSLLIGYLSMLIGILAGIWKTLVSISRQIQRRLDLRESRVLERQQVAVEEAHAEGLSEGYSYCMGLVFAAMLIFIFYYAVAKSGSAQA
jgi:hypothetical protein